MKSPVVISENEVESGMLKPVSTAKKRVARSSGVPDIIHAAGLAGTAVCELVDKAKAPPDISPSAASRRQNGQRYREIGISGQSQTGETCLDR
jgi:hypothetical protein